MDKPGFFLLELLLPHYQLDQYCNRKAMGQAMTDDLLEFPGHSFWDLAEPRHGAIALRQMFGDAAATAAQSCANAAKIDDRDDDYRFWIAVLARIKSWDLAAQDEPPA